MSSDARGNPGEVPVFPSDGLLAGSARPQDVLLPHRILPFESKRFSSASSWYLASFLFDDPAGSGTTGGPHLAYIRTRSRIVREGDPLHLDYFRNARYFEDEEVAVRVHSECLLGDSVLSHSRCDCGAQLASAADEIEDRGLGILLYLRQEGRGIGLARKLEAIEQSTGRKKGRWTGVHLNTESSMLAEGHREADLRDYVFAGRMLRGLGAARIRLLSSNPRKIAALREAGLVVHPSASAGPAGSIENLSELLWKLSRGYQIPFSALSSIESHVQALAEGRAVHPLLHDLLVRLRDLVEMGDGRGHLPSQLVTLLQSHDPSLGSGRAVTQWSTSSLGKAHECQ